MIRGIRGAITVNENTESNIVAQAEKLLRKMISDNSVAAETVSSILISATADIDAAFPAKALRNIREWQYVPVMCMREIEVPGGLPFCIRVMMNVETEKEQRSIKHAYLEGAEILRPDLALTD
ncbi:chorismate mutase [Bacillus lacus]|uniref:chorismate mutase n=1 Tax=Metabacillus lacus TaxID=1983721 RepID=A0A7X2IWB6_9BACI|nr:chorismate mutase [Metabacillus lacus]MRX70997.1 chorismate mutase [Metabacillus lacus]